MPKFVTRSETEDTEFSKSYFGHFFGAMDVGGRDVKVSRHLAFVRHIYHAVFLSPPPILYANLSYRNNRAGIRLGAKWGKPETYVSCMPNQICNPGNVSGLRWRA